MFYVVNEKKCCFNQYELSILNSPIFILFLMIKGKNRKGEKVGLLL